MLLWEAVTLPLPIINTSSLFVPSVSLIPESVLPLPIPTKSYVVSLSVPASIAVTLPFTSTVTLALLYLAAVRPPTVSKEVKPFEATVK